MVFGQTGGKLPGTGCSAEGRKLPDPNHQLMTDVTASRGPRQTGNNRPPSDLTHRSYLPAGGHTWHSLRHTCEMSWGAQHSQKEPCIQSQSARTLMSKWPVISQGALHPAPSGPCCSHSSHPGGFPNAQIESGLFPVPTAPRSFGPSPSPNLLAWELLALS